MCFKFKRTFKIFFKIINFYCFAYLFNKILKNFKC